jgi:hypothetical protein
MITPQSKKNKRIKIKKYPNTQIEMILQNSTKKKTSLIQKKMGAFKNYTIFKGSS